MVDQQFIDRLFRLDNKVALVTGAGQNYGQGIALALGLHGASVVVADIDQDKADATVALLREHDITALASQVDVTDHQQMDNTLAAILAKYGRLDIAFNNVGLCYGDSAEDMAIDDWHNIINTNLNATFYSCQQQCKLMRKQQYGKIINTASVAGILVPHPQKITAYNTAKAAIIHMTRSLAAEWSQYGINVNAISPGTLHVPAFEASDMQPWLSAWQQQIPSGRLAAVKDIVGAAIFLASNASDYMIGQNIIVDGGHTLW